MGRTPFRSIKDHEPLFGTRDRGVEPASAVLGRAAESIVEHDDIRPCRPLGLVTCDSVAPHCLDQALLDPVVAPIALGVALHVVVEVALVDYVPGRLGFCRTDRVTVLGPDARGEADLVLVSYIGQLEEHAV